VNQKTVVTYSLADSVTLNPNGCEEVYIKYTIDKSYFYPNAYVMFGLYSAANNEAQSVYVQPGNGKNGQGKDAWVGDKEMIFCGKAKRLPMNTATRLSRLHSQKESTHSLLV